jgi:N-acetylglucosamine-6-phosphate deacetylase
MTCFVLYLYFLIFDELYYLITGEIIMNTILKNCIIYTGEQVLYNKAIVVKNDKIFDIIEEDQAGPNAIDLQGQNVAPGLIDLQINGGGGKFFTQTPDEVSIQKCFEANLFYGATNFLITLISAPKDVIFKAIDTTRQSMNQNKYGLLGMHLEGPYFNPIKRGAHKFVRPVQTDELKEIIEYGEGVIKVITVAPETFTDEQLHLLEDSNITISAGHSNATYQQAKEAFDSGTTMVTHLFNAMSQFNSREPGLVGATFDSKNVYAGIIVDGHHCDYSVVRVSKNILQDKLFLVTDAMDTGESNEYDISKVNGLWRTPDGNLAGSALTMIEAVENTVKKVGIPIDEALRMASLYPARSIKVDNQFGRIRRGFKANLVIFNEKFNVTAMMMDGQYMSNPNA